MRSLRFKRLERRRIGGSGDQMRLSYPAPRSPTGKVYQFSPNEDAHPRLFLIGDAPDGREVADVDRDKIRRHPGPGQTVCPYSGYMADDDEFVHFDDVQGIIDQVKWEAGADIQDHLEAMAKEFNRGQSRNSFLSINMSVDKKKRPKPLAIREDLLRNLSCNVCQRSYAVFAIGLFCPDCGSANVGLHFQREVELVRSQVALAEEHGQGEHSELGYRLMGNAHEDVLTAFEATLKTAYRQLVQMHLPEKADELIAFNSISNAFQNIRKAQGLYANLGIDPFAMLDDADLNALELNIQKRHIIGHNLSIADERFAERTDQQEIGATIKIIGVDILKFAEICSDVVFGLNDLLHPGSAPGGETIGDS